MHENARIVEKRKKKLLNYFTKKIDGWTQCYSQWNEIDKW